MMEHGSTEKATEMTDLVITLFDINKCLILKRGRQIVSESLFEDTGDIASRRTAVTDTSRKLKPV